MPCPRHVAVSVRTKGAQQQQRPLRLASSCLCPRRALNSRSVSSTALRAGQPPPPCLCVGVCRSWTRPSGDGVVHAQLPAALPTMPRTCRPAAVLWPTQVHSQRRHQVPSDSSALHAAPRCRSWSAVPGLAQVQVIAVERKACGCRPPRQPPRRAPPASMHDVQQPRAVEVGEWRKGGCNCNGGREPRAGVREGAVLLARQCHAHSCVAGGDESVHQFRLLQGLVEEPVIIGGSCGGQAFCTAESDSHNRVGRARGSKMYCRFTNPSHQGRRGTAFSTISPLPSPCLPPPTRHRHKHNNAPYSRLVTNDFPWGPDCHHRRLPGRHPIVAVATP